MHRVLVEEKGWIDEDRFLHALKFCTLLPGPEAQQLATYVGWLLHGSRGGLVAGSLFVLPGVLVLLALSVIYQRFGTVLAVGGLLLGLKAAVLAIVIHAVVKLSTRALPDRRLFLVAIAAFLALALLGAPFPLVVLSAGLIGFLVVRPGAGDDGSEAARDPAPPLARTVTIAVAGLFLWLGPIALLAALLGSGHRLVRMGVFFSQAAVVTFGGAYAVLTYAAQRVVEEFRWLRPADMVDGLALAETTPGPLILVLQFVGYLAGFRAGPPSDGVAGGILASFLTVWTTFVPSMLFVLLGALHGATAPMGSSHRRAYPITAAVLGVIANLALWFSLQALFTRQDRIVFLGHGLDRPVLESVSVPAVVLAVGSALAVFRFRRGMIEVLAGSALIGLLWQMIRLGQSPTNS